MLTYLFTVRSLSMLPPLSIASWVDLSIGDSLFDEKKQARPLAGEQLPCLLLVLLDRLTLLAGVLSAFLQVV